jgi:hypothetical protein
MRLTVGDGDILLGAAAVPHQAQTRTCERQQYAGPAGDKHGARGVRPAGQEKPPLVGPGDGRHPAFDAKTLEKLIESPVHRALADMGLSGHGGHGRAPCHEAQESHLR